MQDQMDIDLGFKPIEEPQPQVETPQVEAPIQEQPQSEPTPQPRVEQNTNDVLSLNDDEAQTPQVQNPTAPTVDRGAVLNELFGTNDAESIKQKLQEYEQLKAQAEKPRYQSKFAEYTDKLVAKYGDPKTQADAFKKTIDVLTTDVASLDDKSAITFQFKQDYPSLSDEEIGLLVNSKYNLNDYATEEQQKIGAVQMKLDAQKAKAEIQKMQEEVLKGAPDQAVLRGADEKKWAADWEQNSQNVAKSITHFEFDLDGKKSRFDIPATEQAKLADMVKEIASGSKLIYNEQSAAQVKELAKMAWLYQNANKLISNAYKKGLSSANAEWANTVHNPSGLRGSGVDLGGRKKGENEYDENDIVRWLEGR